MNKKLRKNLFIHTIILFFIPFNMGFSQNQETGMCSYYASKFHGKRTASGEPYNKNIFTAAHNTLPFQTWIIVTNLSNNKSVKVRVNDRGPHTKSRVLDISQAAANKIGLIQSGITKVRIEICLPDSLSETNSEDSVTAITSGPVSPETKVSSAPVESNNTLKETQFKIGNFYNSSGKTLKLKGYYIQVGSYSNFDTFITNKDEWGSNQKKAVYCEVVKSNSKKLYRLLIGTYPDKAAADKELKALNKKGVKGLIKKF